MGLSKAEWGAGHVILGRYQLESLLGRGGMGSVWRAQHLMLKSPVAVKLLDPAIAEDEQMLQRFMREAQSAAALRSQHVVQIFDYGVEDGTAFIVMEMLQGESLSERLSRDKQLPVEQTVKLLTQVMRAIGKAHEAGIVHRDLKPDNIFICQEGDEEYAKVLDFGVAKVGNSALGASRASKTQSGVMLGTPYYMSPEQTQAKSVDHRADIWALAVIAYECLTGRRPFEGDSFGELVISICTAPVPLASTEARVPPGFDEWFVRGTQRDKAKRFESARAMAEELGALVGQRVTDTQQLAAIRPSHPPPAQPAAPRPQDKFKMTTGQSAATGVSVRDHTSGPPSPLLFVAFGIAAVSVIGAGVFAFREPLGLVSPPDAIDLGSSLEQYAAPPPAPEPPSVAEAEPAPVVEPEPAPSAAAGAEPPVPEASQSDPANAAVRAARQAGRTATAKAAVPPVTEQPVTKQPVTKQPVTKQPATESPVAETKPAPKATSERVPEVKSDPVPPKDWEF